MIKYVSNSSTTNISFVRVDFNVGEITHKEAASIAADIDAYTLDSNPMMYHSTMYDGAHWKEDTINFSVFYNENDDTEKLKKLFFKIELRHPEFKIISSPAFSLRS